MEKKRRQWQWLEIPERRADGGLYRGFAPLPIKAICNASAPAFISTASEPTERTRVELLEPKLLAAPQR